MRIAILGAGATGTCAALELASRGFAVDLYDECDAPVKRASFYNEGKVHLGILYAKDTELRTAGLMIRGALSFASLLNRWIGVDWDRVVLSTPFYYGVHEGTMVDVDGLRAHYASCQKLFAEMQALEGGSYLGLDRAIQIEELSRNEMETLVSPEYFVTMFRTSERAVDPRTIAL
ncbi:MAG TPA: FAD-dependent oxidoreductase, partial [Pyrinomonadaceae bacterium]|nr:FAD-dependent oxidoreductase [Pyrinomonadaceae bacterium]